MQEWRRGSEIGMRRLGAQRDLVVIYQRILKALTYTKPSNRAEWTIFTSWCHLELPYRFEVY